jgi:Pao retrotransposon peptidase/Family of unknown function (DUF5641)/Reverse transcriptase (RNA-dependent DNA polymerase)
MAVLDTGSNSTIIDESFARYLGLEIVEGPYKKQVMYVDRPAEYETSKVRFELVGQDTRVRHTIIAETVAGFGNGCRLVDWSKETINYPYMEKISVLSAPNPPHAMLLIGIELTHLFHVTEHIVGAENEPIANLTPLGWAFMGNRLTYETIMEKYCQSDKSISIFKSDDFLDDMVTRQFDLEQFGLQEKEAPYSKGFNGGPKNPALWSPAEKRADNSMKVKYMENYFQVNIPWLSTHELNLCGNFNMVRLRQDNSHNTKALDKKGITIEEIEAILNGYVTKGYIEEVPKEEQGQGWYLPFFEVVNREKSTPIRLVFDAKATYGKISLNNQIKNTPNRLNDLVLTLMRLRRYEFAVTGDISEMFLRIRVAPEDKQYHRFYHNGKHYQWTRILFGNKSSPNASQKVLTSLGELFGEIYPNAKETVDNSCYMDDCVDSRSTESELQQLVQELPEMLLKADMKLCKFYTNSKNVASKIPRDLIAKEVKFEDKDPFFECNKVLGMVWDAESDNLTFKTKYNTFQDWKSACKIDVWTKRAILKTTASTYDPLGLLSPIIMYPRTIIQQLWAKELDWDTAVPEEIANKWEECLQNLLKVNIIRIPRWVYDNPFSNLELHVFCDASERAYATCIYTRVNSRGGTILTNLVCAKSRVAPLKNESVQRLELVGCVLGTRLLSATNIVYKVPQERVFYYTDSRNSLYWINTPAYKQKTYVYNRSSEIQRVSANTQWSHVATELNPADIGTRYVSTEDLKENTLWFEGPPFLRDPEYKFQHYDVSENDLTEEGAVEMKTPTNSMNFNSKQYFYVGNNGDSNLEFFTQKLPLFLAELVGRYSIGKCWNGLMKFRRILSIIITFMMKLRKEEVRSPYVFERVNLAIYRLSQKASFYEAIETLTYEGKLKKGNILAKYNPFLDEFGILRSNSRLSNLDYIPEETKKPIILSGIDKLTKLIVLEAHWKYEHAVSRSLLLSQLHRSFIVIGITKLVKSISANCLVCQKMKAQPAKQIMAPLQNRLGMPQRVFAETGLDFAGPFEVIQGRAKKRKQYFVLVLTCLQVRAVHFEATENQTTDSVINALSRFVSMRGRPRILVSDNQTSFKSASRELKDFYQFVTDNQEEIINQLNPEGDRPIEWEFIPPRAPHFGGAWEIMVKAMKRALQIISKGQPMIEDDFRTFLCKAMDMINQRPLTKIVFQEKDIILTPNDFLFGRCQIGPSISTLVRPVNDIPYSKLGQRWRQLETLSNNLWHRFLTEILPELAPRQKWKQEFNNLEVGTLVLIIEPNLPRNVWQLGVVEEVDLSRDGFARSAKIKTGTGTYNRPITKLIPLLSGI